MWDVPVLQAVVERRHLLRNVTQSVCLLDIWLKVAELGWSSSEIDTPFTASIK